MQILSPICGTLVWNSSPISFTRYRYKLRAQKMLLLCKFLCKIKKQILKCDEIMSIFAYNIKQKSITYIKIMIIHLIKKLYFLRKIGLQNSQQQIIFPTSEHCQNINYKFVMGKTSLDLYFCKCNENNNYIKIFISIALHHQLIDTFFTRAEVH